MNKLGIIVYSEGVSIFGAAEIMQTLQNIIGEEGYKAVLISPSEITKGEVITNYGKLESPVNMEVHNAPDNGYVITYGLGERKDTFKGVQFIGGDSSVELD